jgi:hypothetical protein
VETPIFVVRSDVANPTVACGGKRRVVCGSVTSMALATRKVVGRIVVLASAAPFGHNQASLVVASEDGVHDIFGGIPVRGRMALKL